MMLERPTVSVIIPTLNEAKNLPLIFPYLPHDLIDEVILVDGCSKDDTVATARRLLPNIKILVERRPGKGAAMRAGYAAATGDILVVLDADGSNDPRELPRFLQALIEGSDFVKGSRFIAPGGTTDMPRVRKFGNWSFVTLVNFLFDMHFTDLCYGYHAFWRYCLDQIDLDGIDGFEIDTAIYLRAARQHLRITEAPSFEGYRFHGVGKLKTIPDGWRVLTTIFREWWLHVMRPVHELHLGFRGMMPAFATASGSALRLEPGSPASESPLWRAVLEGVSEAMLYHPEADKRVSVAEALPDVLQQAVDGVKATSGSIVVFDEDGDITGGCLHYQGQPRLHLPDQTVVENGLAGWIARNRQPALVTSTQVDPRWVQQPWEEQESVSRSAVGVPLIHDQRLVGVMTVTRRARPFTRRELSWLADLTVAA
jgi:hypothetical protein